jgi:phosphoribosylglycinamide formyltransferase 1
LRKEQIAIFASGSGSNAENIARYFQNHEHIEVSLVLTNNKNAFVIERAKQLKIPYCIFNREEFYNTHRVAELLKAKKIDFIVLAGFLWLIPQYLLDSYPDKIINIHPALLPKYGGKGMYGDKVHQAIIEACEKESGITIHFVNDKYDEGKIICQYKCEVVETDTAETLARKIHHLEYKYFPKVIEEIVLENKK